MSDRGIYITIASRSGHCYVWFYTRPWAIEVLRSSARFATDPDYNFTWWDAARVSESVRRALSDDTLAIDLPSDTGRRL